LADVVDEDYMYAENGENGSSPQAVARMQFRVSKRDEKRIGELLQDFAELRPVVQD
jgi:hypothetical protein